MFSRGVVGGARDHCKHLARYVTGKADADHAYGQSRVSLTPPSSFFFRGKPRELQTCVSRSKWRATKAPNLNKNEYSEVAFKGRTKRLSQDCAINVIKDDVGKDTPCIINIYLKSPSENNSRPNESVDEKKEGLSWEEVLTGKTNQIALKPRAPIQLDADVLRSKLSAGNAGINEECRPVRPREPPRNECQELYAQQRLLCYNVSVYNCKASRCAEYQAEYDSKEVMTKMVGLAQKQGGASGISRFLLFCKGLLSADTRNTVRIDAARKWRASQVFRPSSAHITSASVDEPQPRISPRTLSNFELFKTPPDTGGARSQRRNFSSKSDSGGSRKGGPKQNDCSKLDECINKIFAEIKKRCLGEGKEAEKTTCEAPPPGPPRKTSGGKDECLEKSIERLKQITPGLAKDGGKAKKEKGAGPKRESPTCGKDPPPQAEAAPVEKERKAKKICSRASPLPLDATEKETKEKTAVPEREICKKDPPAKKERPICGKEPATVPRDKSSADADARCKSEIMPKTTERKKEPEESFAYRRCIQDGDDTPKEETDCSAPKKEQANERGSCGGKGKRDPCKKYRAKRQQQAAAARKKESVCSQEKTHESKKDTPPRESLQGGAIKKKESHSCPEPCFGGRGKRKEPIGKGKTKDDCDKIVAAERQDVCGPTLPERNKCEGPDDVEQIRRGVLGHTSECLAQRTPDVKAEPHHVCPEHDEDTPHNDECHETIVEARDPPTHDIMKILGRLLDKTAECELRDYYGDSYPNHTYYMYTRGFFYDVNAKLHVCRRPQPHARPETSKMTGEESCDD